MLLAMRSCQSQDQGAELSNTHQHINIDRCSRHLIGIHQARRVLLFVRFVSLAMQNTERALFHRQIFDPISGTMVMGEKKCLVS